MGASKLSITQVGSTPRPYALPAALERSAVLHAVLSPKFWEALGRHIDPPGLASKAAVTVLTHAAAIARNDGHISPATVIGSMVMLRDQGRLTQEEMEAAAEYLEDDPIMPEQATSDALTPILRRRKESEAVDALIKAHASHGDVDAVVARLQDAGRIGEMPDGSQQLGAASLFQALTRHVQSSGRHAATPWDAVNAVYGKGLGPGLHLLVGGPKSGKSQFALQLAVQAAQNGHPAHVIALELGKAELAARLASILDPGGVGHWSELVNGAAEATAIAAASKAGSKLDALPLTVVFPDAYGWHVGQLQRQIEALPAGGKPPLIIVDFLQLVSQPAGSRRMDLRERIGQAAYGLRLLAREHDAIIVAVSSTARNGYAALRVELDGAEPKPKPEAFLGHGKESGELEYSADSVLVMCREDGNAASDGGCWLALAAGRAVRPRWIQLTFDGSRFSELAAGGPMPATSTGGAGW